MRKVKKRKKDCKVVIPYIAKCSQDCFLSTSRLWSDQKGRCYICERFLNTDYQIDHLLCLKKYPELMKKWRNLFLACSYCNNRKSSGFIPLLRPDECDVEEEISQRWLPMENHFEIQRRKDTEAHRQTERLLDKIYNGSTGKSDFRAARFRDDIVMRMNRFCRHLLRAFQLGDKESRETVYRDLCPDAEMLTLKHALLRDIG